MNRNNFLKLASLGLISMGDKSLFGSKKITYPEKSINFSNNHNYIKVNKTLYGEDISDADCDGVVYVKDGEDYFFNQSSTIDIKDFGAVGDGNKDDTQSVLRAFESCIKNKKSLYVSRPAKSYLCSQKIIITDQIYVHGDGLEGCGFNFINSDGFVINPGVKNVIFEKISINQASRYTNKQNSFIAINILGSGSKRPYTHIYRDLFIDGFATAVKLNWLWDSLFDNLKILFGNKGIEILGTSVNNNICNCSISVEGVGSKGLYFSDGSNAAEGWKITNLLTFGADIGIHSVYTSNVYVTTPILDFCNEYGIYLESSSTGPSTNWQIIGGYIAMSGKSIAAVSMNNNVDNNQMRGCKIFNVDILTYPGSSAEAGISLNGKYDVKNKIKDNSFTNFKNDVVFKNNKKGENTIEF